jgi:hypothetical protein
MRAMSLVLLCRDGRQQKKDYIYYDQYRQIHQRCLRIGTCHETSKKKSFAPLVTKLYSPVLLVLVLVLVLVLDLHHYHQENKNLFKEHIFLAYATN